jgi:hypothetical protein
MDDGAEACIGFVGAQGDALEFLEFAEEVLDQAPPFVPWRSSLRWATRKLSESAPAIKGCRKTPALALLNFPQYPMQRYKTFISPVRQ